jgi:hypothetical protein
VLKQATNLKNVVLDLALPGIVGNTTLPRQQAAADDEVQQRALGAVGPIIEDTGVSG